jgi:hypothetical protein
MFLVHGMGAFSHTRADKPAARKWADEVVSALETAWSQLPSRQGTKLSQLVDFVPVSYDSIFYTLTDNWQKGLAQLKDALGAEIYEQVELLEPNPQSFFWDNIVDVLLYRYTFNVFRDVRVRVLDQIVSVMEERLRPGGNSQTQFSVMSHSLGTAVTNEALHYLSTRDIAGYDVIRTRPFYRYFALANVSRVLWREPGSIYDVTGLRPAIAGKPGAVREMMSFRHVADPFPAPLCFTPNWQAPGFREVKVRHVRELNVHGWTHYLAHPAVAGGILQSLFPSLVTAADLKALSTKFEKRPEKLAIKQAVDKIEARYAANFAGSSVVRPFVKTAIQSVRELVTVMSELGTANT